MNNDENKKLKNRIRQMILLVLLALVAISGATFAWFSIADFTRVRSMNMQVTTGVNLRFDLDPHEYFDQYVKTLTMESIADRVIREKGYNMRSAALEPVTTSNYSTFTYENGEVCSVNSGEYYEFTLHFMAMNDMIVHLTSGHGDAGNDGTAINSSTPGLANAMRISFTTEDGEIYVYDPGMGDASTYTQNAKIYGIPSAQYMTINSNNAMFELKEGVNKEVVVRIWMEGTDEACNNSLKKADFSIAMRFEGEVIHQN